MSNRRRASDLAPDPEMWAALDGGRLLRAVLDDFYTRVYADPRLAPFFAGVLKEHVAAKQFAFMRQIFTGEKLYFGDRPRNAHHWMVISDELFDHREDLLMDCLRRHGIEERLVQRWRAIDERFRKQIVKDKPFGKMVRGQALPLEGYSTVELSVGSLCDGCQGEMSPGNTVTYHVRTGVTYCPECNPAAASG